MNELITDRDNPHFQEEPSNEFIEGFLAHCKNPWWDEDNYEVPYPYKSEQWYDYREGLKYGVYQLMDSY